MRGCLSISRTKMDKYIDIMFNAYWKNNLDITNEKTLIFLLKKCEIDTHKFFNKIKDPVIKSRLRDITNEAYKKGVFGAPTFIINNKIFWGQDRLNYATDEYKD